MDMSITHTANVSTHVTQMLREFSPFRAPSQTDECSTPQDPLHIPEEIKSDPLAFGARLGSSGPLLPS